MVSVTVAAALAGWQVTVGVVEVGGVIQPGADAERYRCACWLAGRGDWYQCGLDWGHSGNSNMHILSHRNARILCNT